MRTISRILVATFMSFFLVSWSFAQSPHALCNDLARFACAPGEYKDGTGTTRSEEDVLNSVSDYKQKAEKDIRQRFTKMLSDPQNQYFKDLSVAALGLKNSPQCASNSVDDAKACQGNIVSGLTSLASKLALASMIPSTGLERVGNLRDIQFVTSDEHFLSLIKDISAKAEKDLGNDELKQKIKDKIFPQVKALIVERLKQLDIPDDQKNFMINKIKSIVFKKECNDPGGGSGVASLLIPNAYYTPQTNAFTLCSGLLLQSTSDFQNVAIIAHELSHSIDPCGVAYGPEDSTFKYEHPNDLKKMESEFPIKNVIACLRDPRSVGAKNFAMSENSPSPIPNGPFGRHAEVKKPNFCDNDQITESFADWMAFEILPTYISKNYQLNEKQYEMGYANTFRLICGIMPKDGYAAYAGMNNVHPPMDDRINKLLLVNPSIRQQMGCPKDHPKNLYCDANKIVVPEASANTSDEACDNCKKAKRERTSK